MKVERQEIIIAGVGGQGVVLCGTLLGEAAVRSGLNVTLTTEYGVEARGTLCVSNLIISNAEVYFPYVVNAFMVVCLEQKAYDAFCGMDSKDTLLVYDEDLVKPRADCRVKQVGLLISSAAAALGKRMTANLVSMGLIAGLGGMVDPGECKEAIRKFFSRAPIDVIETDIAAFEKGECLAAELSPGGELAS